MLHSEQVFPYALSLDFVVPLTLLSHFDIFEATAQDRDAFAFSVFLTCLDAFLVPQALAALTL